MNFCNNCGSRLENNSKFCPECGNSIEYRENRPHASANDIVHNCPNCGSVTKAFEGKCSACGCEIKSSRSVNSIKELSAKIEAIEAQKNADQKSLMEKLIGTDLRETDASKKAQKKYEQQKDIEKANIINLFPVPNSKEDIVEFMLLASSHIRSNDDLDDVVSEAWISKFEICYQKANLMFYNDSDFSRIMEMIDIANKKIVQFRKEKATKKNIHRIMRLVPSALGLLMIIISAIINMSGGASEIFELFGGIVLIVPACILSKIKANPIDACIVAASGLATIALSFLFENGSMVILFGATTLIASLVNLFIILKSKSR